MADLRSGRSVAVQSDLDAQGELSQLLAAADFFAQPGAQTSPGCRDCLGYRLTLVQGIRTHTVETDDQGAAANLRPLIVWLAGRIDRALAP